MTLKMILLVLAGLGLTAVVLGLGLLAIFAWMERSWDEPTW